MLPTNPPTARCLSCYQRRLSSDLCPVCQCCSVGGCGCSWECDGLEQEMRVRHDIEEEAAVDRVAEDPGSDAEVEP
jgi:hypothetical protein